MAKLHDFYKDTVVSDLQKKFEYKSVMQVPRIEKITLNMGVGEAIADKKVLAHDCHLVAATGTIYLFPSKQGFSKIQSTVNL